MKRAVIYIRQLLNELTDMGLTHRATANRAERPLYASNLHRLLRNPYYIGMVPYKGVQYPGRHQPLISPVLFEQVQAVLTAHNYAGEKQRIRIAKLERERRRVADLAFKGAIPEDLAAEKQSLIRKQLAHAHEALSACQMAREDIETTLHLALDLVQHCQTAYAQAEDDQQRREWNQFAFVKVGVDVDRVTEAELSPIVASLVRTGRRQYRRNAVTPDHPEDGRVV
jgi:hypothetical protein